MVKKHIEVHEAKDYFERKSFSGPMFSLTLAFAWGVAVAGWHTFRSVWLGLLGYLLFYLLTGYAWWIIGFVILFYFIGWTIGLKIFPCNRGRPIRFSRGQPWRYNCSDSFTSINK